MLMTRAAFWFMWSITAVVSIIYAGTALATFNNVSKVSVGTEIRMLRYGMLGSCFLGFLMVIMFCLVSACVNLSHAFSPWQHNLRPEVGSGVMLGSAIHMIFFMLLAGLALHSGDAWARSRFGSSSITYQVLRVAYGFAYLLSFTFVAMACVIVCTFSHVHGGSMMMHGTQFGTMGGAVPMAAVADTRYIAPTMGMQMAAVPTVPTMAAMPTYAAATTMVPAAYGPPVGYPMR